MKEQNPIKLLIKNMVCQRCVLTVESILAKLEIPAAKVSLGEVELTTALNKTTLGKVEAELKRVGFELIETKTNKIVEDIKKLVLGYIEDLSGEKNIKLSSLITQRLNHDYSYLSDLFSSIEGITIEQYFIWQRIEKVKELIV